MKQDYPISPLLYLALTLVLSFALPKPAWRRQPLSLSNNIIALKIIIH